MSITIELIPKDAPEKDGQPSATQQPGTTAQPANPYKVEIRSSPGWNKFDAVTLGISPLADFWDKEGRLEAVLHFAARKFRKIRIDVSDMLYQHTFLGNGMEAGTAAWNAAALGTEWLRKHEATIDACPAKPEGEPEWKPRGEREWKLETKPEVVRWLEWIRHPDFAIVYAGFKRAYAANPVLRSIHSDIESFHLRTMGRLPSQLQNSMALTI